MRRTPPSLPVIRNLSQVRRLVREFETGCLRSSRWNHRTRLILGLWYVIAPSGLAPLAAMRRGVAAHEDGRQLRPAYHEATTAFYLQKIEAFAIAAPANLGLVELIAALLVSELANPRLHLTPADLPQGGAEAREVVCHERDFSAALPRKSREMARAA